MVAQSARAIGGRLNRPAVLGAVTVLLGGLAVWSHLEATSLADTPAARNGALSDNTRTSEVKGEIADVVNTVFSYNHTDVAKTEKAAASLLTGKAVGQYNAMFAPVRKQAPEQRLVLTTTVTDSAVQLLQGDRARLLIFADQRNTRTSDGESSYSGAMFAVDAVRLDGRWKIAGIDTFTGTAQ